MRAFACSIMLFLTALGAAEPTSTDCATTGTCAAPSGDTSSMIQSKVDLSRLEGHGNGIQTPPPDACDELMVSNDLMDCSIPILRAMGYCNGLPDDGKPLGGAPPGYKKVKSFIHRSSEVDVDKAQLYKKGDDCWFAFMGTDDWIVGDVGLYDVKPIEKWGIKGVHSGLVAELEPIVNQMNFSEIRSMCTGKVTSTGLSMGGALAQLFALVINQKHDPLHAGLNVDFLYTFAALQVADEVQSNPKTADGCFPGAQYWWAQKDGSDYIVDAVARWGKGAFREKGFEHLHILKSPKFFVFEDGSSESFPCGTPLPYKSMRSAIDTLGMATWHAKHGGYLQWLGCRK